MPGLEKIETKLWAAAERLWSGASLMPSEYAAPVLGILFLRYADHRFSELSKQLNVASSRRTISKDDFHARGVVYVPEQARYEHLLNLPEGHDLGRALNEAMELIEKDNEDLGGVLPKVYQKIPKSILIELLKLMSPLTLEGDKFGQIYEYFMGNFAKKTMQKGGEFYTPSSIVELIVQIIEPYHGRIYDPACGSGGMFVHSADFVRVHQKDPGREISVYGIEKIAETLRMCKLNLAIHGLSGDVREANTYHENPHNSVGKFDYVMANPPFNQEFDSELLNTDGRFPFGTPSVNNANYLWIQLFYSSLNSAGRAGFVMASGAEARGGSEKEIRKKLIEIGATDVVMAVGPNMFYTVPSPCTLWFLDKQKKGTPREDQVLFIDARKIYRQVDRSHRDWRPNQIEFIANIVRLYRGEQPEFNKGSEADYLQHFPNDKYVDVPGLCKVATRAEIEAQGWSLSPGSYVDVGADGKALSDEDFKKQFQLLSEELKELADQAHELEQTIASNTSGILEGWK